MRVSSAFGTGVAAGSASTWSKSANGRLSRKTSVRAFGVRTDGSPDRYRSVSWYGPGYGIFGSSRSCTSQVGPPDRTPEAKDRSRPYFTSAAVIGRPFSNRTPARSV